MHVEALPPSCANSHMPTKDPRGQRVRALREALNLTGDRLVERAAAAGRSIDTPTVSKIESGKNKLTTVGAREALAAGLGLAPEALSAYLDGVRGLPETLALAQRGALSVASTPPTPVEIVTERDDELLAMLDDTVLHVATAEDRMEDVIAACKALRAVSRRTLEGADPTSLMRAWVTAARVLRLAGIPATPTEIAVRDSVGRHARSHAVESTQTADLAREGAERAASQGVEPVAPEKIRQAQARAAKSAGVGSPKG